MYRCTPMWASRALYSYLFATCDQPTALIVVVLSLHHYSRAQPQPRLPNVHTHDSSTFPAEALDFTCAWAATTSSMGWTESMMALVARARKQHSDVVCVNTACSQQPSYLNVPSTNLGSTRSCSSDMRRA